MRTLIEIDLEVSDADVLADILDTLYKMLPYMADNVAIRNTSQDGPVTFEQRRALFAAFGEVFADTSDSARYFFTRMVLGKSDGTTVSWSSNKFGAITASEASKVLDALDALNV